jgi:hypothetical protein
LLLLDPLFSMVEHSQVLPDLTPHPKRRGIQPCFLGGICLSSI